MTAVAATAVDPLAPATLGANATALLQRKFPLTRTVTSRPSPEENRQSCPKG